MSILQLCLKPPLPAVDGGCLAMNQTTQMLLQNNSVKVFAISTAKHPFLENKLKAKYKSDTLIESVFVDTSLSVFSFIKALFNNEAYNVARFYNKNVEEKIVQILNENVFDVVVFESVYMAVYLPIVQKYSNAKCVLRSHNIEYILWQTRSDIESSIFKKSYFKLLSKQVEKFEKSVLNKFAFIASITESDEHIIKQLATNANVKTIAFAAEKIDTIVQQKLQPTFYHLGAMDWQPNIEAVLWVHQNLLNEKPLVENKFKFYVAGKNTSLEILNLSAPNFMVKGSVENATNFINEHDVLVAPIFSGGGMRVKIIEAMQLGKVVITTPLGATGIPHQHNGLPCLLIAETKQQFVEAVLMCINNFEYRNNIAKSAVDTMQANFGFDIVAKKLQNFIQ